MQRKSNKNEPPTTLNTLSVELTRVSRELLELTRKGIYSGELFKSKVDWQRYLTTLLVKIMAHVLESIPRPNTLAGFENCTSGELYSILRKKYGTPQWS